jgi:pathogenesis-related protein 1
MFRIQYRVKMRVVVFAVCAGGAIYGPKTANAANCAQPVSTGALVTATDCLFILNVAVGAASCGNECECAPKGALPTTATDALLCLNAATGQPAALECPCQVSTTTTTTTTSTDTTLTTSTTLSTCAGPDAGSYLAGVTDAHNDVRASASPAPDPALDPLCWSDSVAAVAQSWADNCTWQHNPGRGSLGENIFAGSGNWLANGALSAVEMWAAEADYYDYASNSCQSGEVCGHYTQIVWRSSQNVGCGITLCNTGSPFGGGSWTFVVCNYDPPGNWIGQKPY